MADYIDREKLLEHIKDAPTWEIDDKGVHDTKYPKGMFDCEDVVSSIENAPAADVEHVIRCKDCHYSRELNHEDPKERQFIEGCVWCMNWEYGVFPDDYCSNAKRRKDTNGDQNN